MRSFDDDFDAPAGGDVHPSRPIAGTDQNRLAGRLGMSDESCESDADTRFSREGADCPRKRPVIEDGQTSPRYRDPIEDGNSQGGVSLG